MERHCPDCGHRFWIGIPVHLSFHAGVAGEGQGVRQLQHHVGDGGAGAADAGSGRHDHQAGTGTVRLAACRKGDIPIPARARPK